ncbi:MAG: hypothetical protein ACYC3X_05575 [Pirellulaceae bacterium]
MPSPLRATAHQPARGRVTGMRSESRAVETHTRDLSYTVGASANRIANDSVAHDKHHSEVDELFAQWNSDPLQLLSFPGFGM